MYNVHELVVYLDARVNEPEYPLLIYLDLHPPHEPDFSLVVYLDLHPPYEPDYPLVVYLDLHHLHEPDYPRYCTAAPVSSPECLHLPSTQVRLDML